MLKKIDQSHMNDIRTLFLDVFSNEPMTDYVFLAKNLG
jgi:hypothetical protein